jgi:2-polyprenyl-3-methyl-5-hydroxy-6-metoxy-1,4-benzoquinol methylase
LTLPNLVAKLKNASNFHTSQKDSRPPLPPTDTEQEQGQPPESGGLIDRVAVRQRGSTLDSEQIEVKRQKIMGQYGPWTADNFQLCDDVYTIGKDSPIPPTRPLRVTQIISDHFGESFEKLRIADLGTLEGAYAVEFARRGANVVALELRERNLVKSRFAKDVLRLDTLEFVKDDVRNFTVEKYGTFDVVLASGILYHLDVPDIFTFVENVARACTGITIIDTQIGVEPDESFVYKGNTYSGWHFTEYESNPTPEEVEQKNWMSVGNVRSFWLTRASLFNLMHEAGFTSAYECHIPVHLAPLDRLTAVGIKGQPQSMLTHPLWTESQRLPEEPAEISSNQKSNLIIKHRSLVRKKLNSVGNHLPESLKRPFRPLIKAIWPET